VSDVKHCAAFAEDHSALIDGELSSGRAAEVRAHLEACGHCRARVEALRGVDRDLAGLAPPALPTDLRARLQSRIERPGQRPMGHRAPGRRRRWLAAPAAAAAAAAAVAAILYLTPGEPEPALVAHAPSASPGALASPEPPAPPAEALPLGLESVEDLDVIANLELLEAFVALEGGTG
jgi:anti-sigma factor RsiW